MTGFLDVLLRGAMLVAAAVTLGGVAVVLGVLRARPGVKPDAVQARALRLSALGAGAVALAQAAVSGLTLGTLVGALGPAAAPAFTGTPFAWATLLRVGLGVIVAGLLAVLARRASGPAVWGAGVGGAVLLVASSAGISHAMARVDHRVLLLGLDAGHQLAAAVWVGGLLHLLIVLRDPSVASPRALARRFSTLALASVVTLVAAGLGLTVAYVGDPAALLETAYGLMVLTKMVLLVAILAIGFANFRSVRRAVTGEHHVRMARLVEVEIGLAVTVLFAAASLTSLPPAVDVHADRATLAEVGARFTAMPPRLTSPAIGELLARTNPLAGRPEARLAIEREWSEFNHHWAGVFVIAMGMAATAHRLGVRAARHWPLLLVGLAAFLFVRNDPEVWPLGPIGFWESLGTAEILQHRLFMGLVVAFGVFEWAVRTGRLPRQPWAYVFPVLCAVGGGLLLTHSHTVFDLKEAFLMEVTHAPIGVLGACAGWARWLELRLPEAGPLPGRVWPACLTAVGVILLFYSEG